MSNNNFAHPTGATVTGHSSVTAVMPGMDQARNQVEVVGFAPTEVFFITTKENGKEGTTLAFRTVDARGAVAWAHAKSLADVISPLPRSAFAPFERQYGRYRSAVAKSAGIEHAPPPAPEAAARAVARPTLVKPPKAPKAAGTK